MGKKGKKNILPTILLEKKILDDRNHPPPPPRVKWSAPNSQVVEFFQVVVALQGLTALSFW